MRRVYGPELIDTTAETLIGKEDDASLIGKEDDLMVQALLEGLRIPGPMKR